MAKKKPDTKKKKDKILPIAEEKPQTPAAGKSSPAKEQTRNERIEEYLGFKYQFRFNVIKCKTEYKEHDSGKDFEPLTKYSLNSIRRELDLQNLTTSTDNLRCILESSFSEAVNPITKYFETLPPHDHGEYIIPLARTVSVFNDANWETYFTKWMVATVANVFITSHCANHTVLVFTGEQRIFKSTWLNNLVPRNMRKYLYIGKINPNDKDSLARLADYWLINIDDQLRQLNRQDENQLKSLITQDHVSFRRPYDPFDTDYPHIASFMGSVNGNDFLTDPTGSGRFLPFHIKSIDINTAQKMDMGKVWAQAYYLFKSGFRYWFQGEENAEIIRHNEEFQVHSDEENLLLKYFAPATEKETGIDNYMLTYSEVKVLIEEKTKSKLNSKRLSDALVKCGFIKAKKRRHGNPIDVWFVKQKTGEEVAAQSYHRAPDALAEPPKPEPVEMSIPGF